MSCYCTHLLVPQPPDVCPAPASVARFLQAMIDCGLFSETPTIYFRTLKRVTPTVRTGRNPSTGEVIELHMPSRVADRQLNLSNVIELPSAVGEAGEYDVNVEAMTKPRIAPLPLPVDAAEPFDDPYYLRVGCRVRGQTVRLSPSAGLFPEAGLFEDCPASEMLGRFVHPHTMEEILVAGAGCARFWIEIQLGKWLIPRIDSSDLNILHPDLQELAVACFGVPFVQGFLCG